MAESSEVTIRKLELAMELVQRADGSTDPRAKMEILLRLFDRAYGGIEGSMTPERRSSD
jgi:hypothetical protein